GGAGMLAEFQEPRQPGAVPGVTQARHLLEPAGAERLKRDLFAAQTRAQNLAQEQALDLSRRQVDGAVEDVQFVDGRVAHAPCPRTSRITAALGDGVTCA